MDAALEPFRAGLKQLRDEVHALLQQWEVLKVAAVASSALSGIPEIQHLRTLVGKGIFRRQFEYNSVVVTLYGAFEQLVESLATNYVIALDALVGDYRRLPPQILRTHLEQTTALLSKPELQRFRDTVTPEELVRNLHACLSGAASHSLNIEAFAYHTANFRVEAVDQYLSRIGISDASSRCMRAPMFRAFLEAHYADRLSKGAAKLHVLFEVDDLADRRNEVAHGSTSQTLSLEILLSYVDFFAHYGEALADVVKADFLRHEIPRIGRSVGRPIAVFDNSIVCFELLGACVAEGDRIITTTGDGGTPYQQGKVLEIQLDGVRHQKVICQKPTKVGLRVDFRATKAQSYFLMEPAATPWELA